MNIDIVKSHCDDIKLIGKGKYGKVYYLKFKNKNLLSRIQCSFCRKYYKKDIAIKQIMLGTECDSISDLEVENSLHQTCYNNKPDFFLKIYDFWIQNTKYDLINNYSLSRNIGYFTLEYMNHNNLNIYLKELKKNNCSDKKMINIQTSILFIIYILDFLHNTLNICHGDISLNNIFIHDTKNLEMVQNINVDGINYQIPTNGFILKIGDFSVSEKINDNNNKFIKRDYIIYDQLHTNYIYWKDLTDYNTGRVIKKFLSNEIISILKKDKKYFNNYENFWNKKSGYIDENILYYDLPSILLKKYLDLFNDNNYTDA